MHVLAETAAATVLPTLSPEQLRCLYEQKSESGRKSATRKGLWTAVAAYLAYSFTDYLFIGDVVQYTVAGRLAVGVSALCVLEFLLYRKAKADTVDMAAAMSVLVAYLVWLLTAQMTRGRGCVLILYGVWRDLHDERQLILQFPVSGCSCGLRNERAHLHWRPLYLFAPMLLLHKLILGAFCISLALFSRLT